MTNVYLLLDKPSLLFLLTAASLTSNANFCRDAILSDSFCLSDQPTGQPACQSVFCFFCCLPAVRSTGFIFCALPELVSTFTISTFVLVSIKHCLSVGGLSLHLGFLCQTWHFSCKHAKKPNCWLNCWWFVSQEILLSSIPSSITLPPTGHYI